MAVITIGSELTTFHFSSTLTLMIKKLGFSLFRGPLVVILLLFLFSSTAVGQQVQTYTDKDTLRVGDRFTYSIVLSGDYTLLEYPDEPHFPDDIELLNRQRFQLSEVRDSLVYNLQFFGVENMIIPENELRLQTGDGDTLLYTSEIPLVFQSTLSEDDEEFRPFKPIFDFARALWPYILGGLLLLIAGWYLYKYWKRKQAEANAPKPVFKREPFINPMLELKKDMTEVKALTPCRTEEDFDRFYVKLGDTIRAYIKRVYQFPALEMTSSEIIRELQKERANSDLIKATKKVLFEADMVKFANFTPDNEQTTDALHTADNFVHTAETVDREKIDYMEFKHDERQEERLQAFKEKHITPKNKENS